MSTRTISLEEVVSALPRRRRAGIERAAARLIAEIDLDEELLDLQRRIAALDKSLTVLIRDRSGHTVDLTQPDAINPTPSTRRHRTAPQTPFARQGTATGLSEAPFRRLNHQGR